MSLPIAVTKFYIPTSHHNVVLRRRLMDRLNKGYYHKLMLISAPAGYGKSTLVYEWLADCERPAAWLSLEEADNELTRFLTCLIFSLQTLENNIGADILAMLQAPQPPPIETFLITLLNEIADIPHPFILVLDDYHVVNSSSINEALFFLIEHLPTQMQVVMTTREDPSIPLAQLRVKDQLMELRAADMRFTPSESEEYLNGLMGLSLSKDIVASLELTTEGWIAALHLAALSIQGKDDSSHFIHSFNGNHAFIFDYLVEEILQRQPEAVSSFLLITSILDRLCSSLCDAIILDPEVSSNETLKHLYRKNLFVVPLDNERKWYRYHHLFADVLRKKLQEKYSESDIAQWHKRASIWYEENDLEVEAYHHAIHSQDIEHAAYLLEGKGMPLHLRGAASISLKWLMSLPTKELDAKPALWVFYGSALLMAGKPTEVEHKLRAAEAVLSQAEEDLSVRDLIGLIAATRATLASLMLSNNNFQSSERQLQAAEVIMKHTTSYDKTDELVGLIAPTANVMFSMQQGIDHIIVQSHRALKYLRADNIPVRTAAAWMLGVACQRKGDYAAARDAYNQVILNSQMIGHQLMAATAMTGLGQLDEAENKISSATIYYKDALLLGNNLPLPVLREAQLGLERVGNHAMKSTLLEPLSQREMEVLHLIANGLSNRDIGEKLFLALDTVKGHNRRIFEKLQVKSRTEAIARANELNLLPNRHN